MPRRGKREPPPGRRLATRLRYDKKAVTFAFRKICMAIADLFEGAMLQGAEASTPVAQFRIIANEANLEAMKLAEKDRLADREVVAVVERLDKTFVRIPVRPNKTKATGMNSDYIGFMDTGEEIPVTKHRQGFKEKKKAKSRDPSRYNGWDMTYVKLLRWLADQGGLVQGIELSHALHGILGIADQSVTVKKRRALSYLGTVSMYGLVAASGEDRRLRMLTDRGRDWLIKQEALMARPSMPSPEPQDPPEPPDWSE